MTDAATTPRLLRALAPAMVVALLLGLMIWGGIARNRQRVQGARERHAGLGKLENYGLHALRFLESRRGADGLWRCEGRPDPALTRRILLNLRGTSHARRPAPAPGALTESTEEIAAGTTSPDPGGPSSPAAAYLASLVEGSGPGGAAPPAAAGALQAVAAEPIPGDAGLMELAVRIHLAGRACLEAGDPCRGLDAALGRLASRLDPAGGWPASGASWPEGCPGTAEETTAAGIRALDTYMKVLSMRAGQSRAR